MFSGDFSDQPKDGCYFIDCDGEGFHAVLNFLRHGQLIVSDMDFLRLRPQLIFDAQYYGIQGLHDRIEEKSLELDAKAASLHAEQCAWHDQLLAYLSNLEKCLDGVNKRLGVPAGPSPRRSGEYAVTNKLIQGQQGISI